MNTINPQKLLHSKWTAVKPENKEKHFLVTELERDDAGTVMTCTLEAVMSKNTRVLNWRDLKDPAVWLQGWK